MHIIDTHLHLIDLDRFSYPWLAAVPALNRHFSLQDYWRQAQSLGITAALHMEVDVAEGQIAAETAWATTLGAPIVGAIAACRPEAPGFPAWLDQVAANPRVRGLRRILHTSPDDLGRQPLFLENLRRLSALGLPFDLCVLARQLGVAVKIVEACPDVQFVLDHCGVPDIKGGDLTSWRQGISQLAALPNIACKISGIVAYAAPLTWTIADLRPVVEHCIEAFGWPRVVWGSDHPVCTLTADLGRWVQATRDLIKGASEAEQLALLSGNAERIYRLT